jgi:1,4-alpha-glucan branching enzyme
MKQHNPSLLPPTTSVPSRPEGVLKSVPIRFEFRDPTALSVAVAGTFNDWDPKKHVLNKNGDGVWAREAKLNPGQHEYCMVVDGHWMPDPVARESRPNPFGGRNSVLIVTATHNGSSSSSSSVKK